MLNNRDYMGSVQTRVPTIWQMISQEIWRMTLYNLKPVFIHHACATRLAIYIANTLSLRLVGVTNCYLTTVSFIKFQRRKYIAQTNRNTNDQSNINMQTCSQSKSSQVMMIYRNFSKSKLAMTSKGFPTGTVGASDKSQQHNLKYQAVNVQN